jgi:FkbM family methyltransferase
MSRLASVRTAFKARGTAEVVRRVRIRVATRIYPGPLPVQKAGAKRKQTPRKAPVLPAANEVDLDGTRQWAAKHSTAIERVTAAIAQYVEPDGVFFDVGANLGDFTKVLAARTGFTGTAHLFEPIPNLARLAESNLAGVPFDVRVHNFGLSDADGEVDIYMSILGNLGWNTMIGQHSVEKMKAMPVQVKAFATCGIQDVPSFIKIDVEGAEHLVLNGMFPALSSWEPKPVILCEVGWGPTHPNLAEQMAALEQLEKLGYRATDLVGDPVDVTTLQSTTDVLFLPQG